MASVASKIDKIRQALISISGLDVSHYYRTEKTPPFCVWAEDGEGESLQAGNHKAEQVVTGSVDYFTKTEDDPKVEAIQAALNAAENVSWYINSVQYEDDPIGVIHYEWRWEVI